MAYGCPDNWCWDRREKSHEAYLSGPHLRTIEFHPDWSHGTAAVLGTRALSRGSRYYWEIEFSNFCGTSQMVGVSSKGLRLHVNSFIDLVGENNTSWGLNHKGLLWHDGRWRRYTAPLSFNTKVNIGLLYDGVSGCLTFYKNNVSLGVAFTGLHETPVELYPVVSSTVRQSTMTLVTLKREFTSLQDRCRSVILSRIAHKTCLDRLCLPTRMRLYLADGAGTAMESIKLAGGHVEPS